MNDPEVLKLIQYCAITGALFFLLGLLLGRRWRLSGGGRGRKPEFRGGKPAFQGKGVTAPRKEGPAEIYVGNLPLETTKEDVEKEFGRFGRITNIRLITKQGENKSFGFVEMAVPAEADAAIQALSGKDYRGNELEVNIAKSPRGHRRHHRH